MANAWAVLIPTLAILFGYYQYAKPEGKDGRALEKEAKAAEAEEYKKLLQSWWSPLSADELAANLLRECEEREVEYRQELAAEPEGASSWKVKAKLAMSLLETNGSRIIPLPERFEEGRKLAEQAFAAKPKNWRTMLAKVALLLAGTNDVKSEEASALAAEAVHARQNRFTNAAMGRAYLVDGCAQICKARRAFHRKELDPPNAVYPAGKEPQQLAQAHMKAAMDRFKESGKRIHSAVDSELFEKDNTTYGPDADTKVSEATFIHAMGPYLPLLHLEQMKGGIHPNTLFAAGGCSDFIGRRLEGKICPSEEPPKKKRKKKKGAAPVDAS